jgi:hypothetical protein
MKKAVQKKRGLSPFLLSPFLYFDYSGTEKSERWKKGDRQKGDSRGKRGQAPFLSKDI